MSSDLLALYLRLLGDRPSPATRGALAFNLTPRQRLERAIEKNRKARL